MCIYNTAHQQCPPTNHITDIASSPSRPPAPAEPDFGLDSPLGLLSSLAAAPLYLHATLRGKPKAWDDILGALPMPLLLRPTLDVGCGRGIVLLKTARRKKNLASSSPSSPPPAVAPAYGIDIFRNADQTGNTPRATYKNAAAMDVLDLTVLHTASFTKTFPFADGVFGLVTASLSIHNAQREGRVFAVKEMARVCAPGGRVIIVDLYGYFKQHRRALEESGIRDIRVSLLGFGMIYGILPCQLLTAIKP
ncbi:methyltransferase [Metarhizium brunneum]